MPLSKPFAVGDKVSLKGAPGQLFTIAEVGNDYLEGRRPRECVFLILSPSREAEDQDDFTASPDDVIHLADEIANTPSCVSPSSLMPEPLSGLTLAEMDKRYAERRDANLADVFKPEPMMLVVKTNIPAEDLVKFRDEWNKMIRGVDFVPIEASPRDMSVVALYEKQAAYDKAVAGLRSEGFVLKQLAPFTRLALKPTDLAPSREHDDVAVWFDREKGAIEAAISIRASGRGWECVDAGHLFVQERMTGRGREARVSFHYRPSEFSVGIHLQMPDEYAALCAEDAKRAWKARREYEKTAGAKL